MQFGMDLEKIKRRILCNQQEKKTLLNSNFVEETNGIFRMYLSSNIYSVNDIVLRLEIVSLLITVKERFVLRTIRENVGLYFEVFMKILSKELEAVSMDIVGSFMEFYDFVHQNNQCIEIEAESEIGHLEDQKYKEVIWVNNPENRLRNRRSNRINEAEDAILFSRLDITHVPENNRNISSETGSRTQDHQSFETFSTQSTNLAAQINEERLENAFDTSSESHETTITDIEDRSSLQALRIIRHNNRNEGSYNRRFVEIDHSTINMDTPYELMNQTAITPGNQTRTRLSFNLEENGVYRVNEVMNTINNTLDNQYYANDEVEENLLRLERIFNSIVEESRRLERRFRESIRMNQNENYELLQLLRNENNDNPPDNITQRYQRSLSVDNLRTAMPSNDLPFENGDNLTDINTRDLLDQSTDLPNDSDSNGTLSGENLEYILENLYERRFQRLFAGLSNEAILSSVFNTNVNPIGNNANNLMENNAVVGELDQNEPNLSNDMTSNVISNNHDLIQHNTVNNIDGNENERSNGNLGLLSSTENSIRNEVEENLDYSALINVIGAANIISEANITLSVQPEIDNTLLTENIMIANKPIETTSDLSTDQNEEFNKQISAEIETSPVFTKNSEILLFDQICLDNKIKKLVKCFAAFLFKFIEIDEKISLFFIYIYIVDYFRFLESYYNEEIMSSCSNIFFDSTNRGKYFDLLKKKMIFIHFNLTKNNSKLYAELLNNKNTANIHLNTFEFLKSEKNEINENYLRCYAKWLINTKGNTQMDYQSFVISVRDLLLEEKEFALFYLGLVCSNNLYVQNFCSEISVTGIILRLLHKRLYFNGNIIHIVFSISQLIELSDVNRKTFCTCRILKPILHILKSKTLARKFDKMFLVLLIYLKNSTKCLNIIRFEHFRLSIIDLLLLILKYCRKNKAGCESTIFNILDDKVQNESKICSHMLFKEALLTIGNLMMGFGCFRTDFIAKGGPCIIIQYFKRRNFEDYALFIFKNLIYDGHWSITEKILSLFSKKYKSIYKCPEDNTTLLLSSSENETKEIDAVEVERIISNVRKHLMDKKNKIETEQQNIFYAVFSKHNTNKTLNLNIKALKTIRIYKELFGIIRNITCNDMKIIQTFLTSFPLILDNVLFILIRFLRQRLFTKKIEVICEILYVIANLCAFESPMRDLFSSELLLPEMSKLFEIKDRSLILALIWFVMNLSWPDDDLSTQRIERLKKYKFKEWLSNVKEIDAYLNDKAVTVLDNFDL